MLYRLLLAAAVSSSALVHGIGVISRVHSQTQQHQYLSSTATVTRNLRSTVNHRLNAKKLSLPSVPDNELENMSKEEEEKKSFLPGRVLVAGNKHCVNKCSTANECRSFGKAAPDKKNACIGNCHRECSVCPLSSVTNDCRKACESQCSINENGNEICWHACLEKCPCEDLGDQLFDVLDMIPDYFENNDGDQSKEDDVVDLGNSGVPVGIDKEAESLVLQAALSDQNAKAALLSSLRSISTSKAGEVAQDKSKELNEKMMKVDADLEKERINGKDETKILELEKEKKKLQNLAEEQLQDGHLAAGKKIIIIMMMMMIIRTLAYMKRLFLFLCIFFCLSFFFALFFSCRT